MAYIYTRTLIAGYGPYSWKDFYEAEIHSLADFDAAFVKSSVKLLQAAFSHKSPDQIASPSELYFNQLFIRHPQTGEKLFVPNLGDFSFLQKIHSWWSGIMEPLATTAVAAAFCDVPAEGFIQMGKQNFQVQEVVTLQSDRGYIPISDIASGIDFEQICSLYETYSCGRINDALLKQYPVDPSSLEAGSFLGYDPLVMPEYTIEMWAARQCRQDIRKWTRLTLLAPLLQTDVMTTDPASLQTPEEKQGRPALQTDTAPESEEQPLTPTIDASIPAEPAPIAEGQPSPQKKYARTRYASFEAFAQNVKKSHRESLPLLQDVLQAFSARFFNGIAFEYQKSKVAILIADNKSRVRNLVNLVPGKDGRVNLQSAPLGLELPLQNVDDITNHHWQLLISYFNEHSETKAGINSSPHRKERATKTEKGYANHLSPEQSRSIANTVGREIGRSIIRGVLSSLFEARRK